MEPEMARGVNSSAMRFIVLTASVMLSLAAGQRTDPTRPLPMAEVEACQIEFTNPIDMSGVAGKWGGQIALYEAESGDAGSIVSLKRRIIEDREHLPKRVRLDQFEECVRKWKFDGSGAFVIRLLGGPIWGGFWVIDVMQDSRVFRLRFPVARPKP